MAQPRAPIPPDPDDVRPGSLSDVLADDAWIADLDCADDDVSGATPDLAELTGCRIVKTSFAGGRWRKPEWVNLVLEHCDLANLRLEEPSWRRVRVAHARLTGLQLAPSTLEDVTVEDSTGELVNLRQARISRTAFTGCTLPGIDFGEARLTDVSFRDCDLTGVQFSGARVQRVRFTDCVLDGIGGITDLAGVTIAGADPEALVRTFAQALRITLE